MLTARVQHMLGVLDERIAQEGGMPPYPKLEGALQTARASGDDAGVAEASLEMALRLSAIASVVRSLADQADADLPTPEDVLEPAINLLNESLDAAQRLNHAHRIAFVRTRLADAYLQSKQFGRARDAFLDVAAALKLPQGLWLMLDTAQKLGDAVLEWRTTPMRWAGTSARWTRRNRSTIRSRSRSSTARSPAPCAT